MTKAAIYCRKSTQAERGDSGASVSVERQQELARVFAVERGWSVAPEHVFVDDAISGGEYERRPAYQRMMATLPARAFDRIVVMDQSRLGRDTGRVLLAIQAIEEAGVELWSYATRSRISLEDESGEVSATVMALVDKLHKRQSSRRTREGLYTRAQGGFATGLAPYGYSNQRTPDGTRGRLVVDANEAAIVRRIFEAVAGGMGMRTLARTLNREGVPGPRAQAEWRPRLLRRLIVNTVYVGQVIYGREQTVMRGGTKRRVRVPESEWLRRQDESLRIVSAELWQQAQTAVQRSAQRWTSHRGADGRLTGKPQGDGPSVHLLGGGLLRCRCGGSLVPISRPNRDGSRRSYYVCGQRAWYGSARCNESRMVPYLAITDAIVNVLKGVGTEVLAAIIERDRLEWEAAASGRHQAVAAARATVAKLDAELARLAQAVADGGSIKALVTRMERSQRERDEAAARLEHAEGQAAGFDPDWHRHAHRVSAEVLRDLRGALERRGAEGHAVLRSLITVPLTVKPDFYRGIFAGWVYRGEASLFGLFAGRIRLTDSLYGRTLCRGW